MASSNKNYASSPVDLADELFGPRPSGSTPATFTRSEPPYAPYMKTFSSMSSGAVSTSAPRARARTESTTVTSTVQTGVSANTPTWGSLFQEFWERIFWCVICVIVINAISYRPGPRTYYRRVREYTTSPSPPIPTSTSPHSVLSFGSSYSASPPHNEYGTTSSTEEGVTFTIMPISISTSPNPGLTLGVPSSTGSASKDDATSSMEEERTFTILPIPTSTSPNPSSFLGGIWGTRSESKEDDTSSSTEDTTVTVLPIPTSTSTSTSLSSFLGGIRGPSSESEGDETTSMEEEIEESTFTILPIPTSTSPSSFLDGIWGTSSQSQEDDTSSSEEAAFTILPVPISTSPNPLSFLGGVLGINFPFQKDLSSSSTIKVTATVVSTQESTSSSTILSEEGSEEDHISMTDDPVVTTEDESSTGAQDFVATSSQIRNTLGIPSSRGASPGSPPLTFAEATGFHQSSSGSNAGSQRSSSLPEDMKITETSDDSAFFRSDLDLEYSRDSDSIAASQPEIAEKVWTNVPSTPYKPVHDYPNNFDRLLSLYNELSNVLPGSQILSFAKKTSLALRHFQDGADNANRLQHPNRELVARNEEFGRVMANFKPTTLSSWLQFQKSDLSFVNELEHLLTSLRLYPLNFEEDFEKSLASLYAAASYLRTELQMKDFTLEELEMDIDNAREVAKDNLAVVEQLRDDDLARKNKSRWIQWSPYSKKDSEAKHLKERVAATARSMQFLDEFHAITHQLKTSVQFGISILDEMISNEAEDLQAGEKALELDDAHLPVLENAYERAVSQSNSLEEAIRTLESSP